MNKRFQILTTQFSLSLCFILSQPNVFASPRATASTPLRTPLYDLLKHELETSRSTTVAAPEKKEEDEDSEVLTGSPPGRSDDTGTPDPGHWEINFVFDTGAIGKHKDFEESLDLNLGVAEGVQFKIEAPLMQDLEGGRGFGNVELGVKWRWYNNEKTEIQISIYPQIALPGNPEDVHSGLANRGPTYLLPMEIRKEISKRAAIYGEFGPVFDTHGPLTFMGGIGIGYRVSKRLDMLLEFHAEEMRSADSGWHYLTLGGAYKLNLKGTQSLFFSVSRSVNQPQGESTDTRLMFGLRRVY